MPTITRQQGLNGYAGTQDTQVNSNDPSTLFGSENFVSVDGKTPKRGESEGLLQFTGLDLPDGALVTSAVLTLNTIDEGAGATLYQMTRVWSEASTYDSLGSGVQVGVETDSDPEFVTGFVSNTGLINIDVKDSVQSWADGAPNYGWYFQPSSKGNDGWDFSSSEGTIKPKLTITYTLDGTIPDPDPEPVEIPEISISDAIANENDGAINFTVSLSGTTTNPVSVNYASEGGTASGASGDYAPVSGTLTFAPGETSKSIGIVLNNDTLVEANETFKVNLTNAVYGVLLDSSGVGTIVSDDGGTTPQPSSPFSGTVSAVVETASMPTPPSYADGDVADDPAIWYDAVNPGKSVIIGSSKDTSKGGLYVFDLAGNLINSAVTVDPINNVDLRHDFKLGSSTIDLVAGTNRGDNTIDFFRFNPTTRDLEPIGSVATGFSSVYGFTMSNVNGVFSAYVSNTSGDVRQFTLDGSSGSIKATTARTLDVGSATIEGMVVDDPTGDLYVAQETGSIWKYGPTGTAREEVDNVGSPQLSADIEGLAIYYGTGGGGYLLASSQGSSSFAVYDRDSGNDYLGSFKVGGTSTIDAVSGTDGMDVTNLPLGSAFPDGAVVVHDHTNTGGGTSNFKIVDWGSIATLGGLTVDTTAHSWMF